VTLRLFVYSTALRQIAACEIIAALNAREKKSPQHGFFKHLSGGVGGRQLQAPHHQGWVNPPETPCKLQESLCY
jgi:hypothetical protein